MLLLPLRQGDPLGLNSFSSVIDRGTTLSLPSPLLPLHLPSLRQPLLSLLPLRQAGRLKPPCRQRLLSDHPNRLGRPSPLLSLHWLWHPSSTRLPQQLYLTLSRQQPQRTSLHSGSVPARTHGSR